MREMPKTVQETIQFPNTRILAQLIRYGKILVEDELWAWALARGRAISHFVDDLQLSEPKTSVSAFYRIASLFTF
jgi:hypothetical protein